MSPRHLSFLETGRSRPSAPTVRRLAEGLDVPLDQRNALYSAAGLTPPHRMRPLEDPEMAPFRRVIQQIEAALVGKPLPPPGTEIVACPRFRVGPQTIRTLTTVCRFDSALEPVADALRIELIFPQDEAADRFFHHLVESTP